MRLIEGREHAQFDKLLEKEHYLHSARPGSRHLRSVAEVDGRWLALIASSEPVPHVQARDRKIGWSPRLHLLVNNRRFLHLPVRRPEPGACAGRLRNGVLGLFEWGTAPGPEPARSFPSWRRCLPVGHMIGLIIRPQ